MNRTHFADAVGRLLSIANVPDNKPTTRPLPTAEHVAAAALFSDLDQAAVRAARDFAERERRDFAAACLALAATRVERMGDFLAMLERRPTGDQEQRARSRAAAFNIPFAEALHQIVESERELALEDLHSEEA